MIDNMKVKTETRNGLIYRVLILTEAGEEWLIEESNDGHLMISLRSDRDDEAGRGKNVFKSLEMAASRFRPTVKLRGVQ